MPGLDDLLAGDEAVEDSSEPAKQDNQANAAQRKLAKAEKELEELRAFKAEQERIQRDALRKQAAEAAGVPWAQVEFVKALDSLEEPTAEAVRALQVQYGLVESEGESAPEPEARGFTPTVISESEPLGSKVWDAEEFEKLARMDPKRAAELYKSGRVKKAESPWASGQPLVFDHRSLD